MANPYFRKLPSFEYVSRLPDAKIGDYTQVKNLFKKGALRQDIFENLSFFEKYKIRGNDRPDNVAYEIYNDSSLDWVILLANNIINIQTEWPLTQNSFDAYLRTKYGNGLTLQEDVYNVIYNGIHHHETLEVKNSKGITIVPAGLTIDSDVTYNEVTKTFEDNTYYSVNYYDFYIDQQVDSGNIAVPITNYEYEDKIEDDKRNIYILKPKYLNIVLDDMTDMMRYKEGSSQYKTETLKRADDIRLYI
jgi:hypothetical protein